MLNHLLKADQRYTFSSYFKMPFTVRDILRGFGLTLTQEDLHFTAPCADPDLTFLHQILERNKKTTRLENEQSRRSALISPVLVEVCNYTNLLLDNEYAVSVSPHLTGIIDFQIESDISLLIIEAKEFDLVAGFRQLVVEMLAAALWKDKEMMFGCVTDGEKWQFAQLNLRNAVVCQDAKMYSADNLDSLVGAMISILQPEN